MRQFVAQADWRQHTIRVFSQDSGETLYQLEPDAEAYLIVDSVTFVPGTEYIAFVGNPDEPAQGNFLWNLETGEVEILPKYAIEYLTDMAAFDSQTIIGYGRGSLLYFWDVETRSVAARLNRYAISVDVSDDLTRMATGSGYMVEIWDYQTIVDQLAGR
jgi:WD40 repeat protein